VVGCGALTLLLREWAVEEEPAFLSAGSMLPVDLSLGPCIVHHISRLVYTLDNFLVSHGPLYSILVPTKIDVRPDDSSFNFGTLSLLLLTYLFTPPLLQESESTTSPQRLS
jgi:hypothetical protein